MLEKIDLSYALGLEPKAAMEYFRARGLQGSWNWEDLWQEAHAKSFTVAKCTRMDVLQDIKDELDSAIASGIPFQQFKKDLIPKLQAKGWWGKPLLGDGKGEASAVQLGSPRRLETIYRTNMQTSYMAGRYKGFMENVDDRPYWQYVAVMDGRTRQAHRLLHGKVFRYDDPFWETHYPPLGFNCRCRVRALSDTNLEKRGLQVESARDQITWQDRLVNKKSGEMRPVAVYRDPVTGKDISTDPGWSYNPGKAAWFPELDKYDYDVARQWIQGGLNGPDFKAFYEGKTGGNYPVAVIDEAYRKTIGSKSQVVILSGETLIKNKAAHPEVLFAVYQKLPDMIERAQLIVQDGDNTFVFLRVDKKIYYGAIKATGSGETNFLTSLRKAEMKDVESIKRKGRVLKDEL